MLGSDTRSYTITWGSVSHWRVCCPVPWGSHWCIVSTHEDGGNCEHTCISQRHMIVRHICICQSYIGKYNYCFNVYNVYLIYIVVNITKTVGSFLVEPYETMPYLELIQRCKF